MLLRIVSDLHIEFWRTTPLCAAKMDQFFVPHDDTDKDAVLVIAGDLCEAVRFEQSDFYFDIIKRLSARFRHIIYVMGNHDHYHGQIERTHAIIIDALSGIDNFTILDNTTLQIDDVKFVGATLWTDYNNEDPWSMDRYKINDFMGMIKTWSQGALRTFNPHDSVLEHKISRGYIDNQLSQADGKVVVVTHHAPSWKSIDAKYQQPPYNAYNCCFVSDLSGLIEAHQPAMWIHGHVHDGFDYNIGKTRVICNPFAYPGENGKNRWVENLIVEV